MKIWALVVSVVLWSAHGSLLTPAFAGTERLSLKQVQEAIKKSGAQWQAGDKWTKDLPHGQIERMLGVPQEELDDLQNSFVVPETAPATPEVVDWRLRDGVNWVSPMLNQGNCGSCVAFATVATLETQINVSSGLPWLNPTFSTQALFSCGGASCDFGWQPELASRFLQKTGVPDEACAPYTMGATGQDVSCKSICSDASQRAFKIDSYVLPTKSTKNIDAVRAALKHGPLVTTLLVYDDFALYTGGIYKHVVGAALGGHAVSIVGYNDNERTWIIRNSWGKDWGESGFGRISWDDISGVGNTTWQYNLAQKDGYVTFANIRGRDFISGKAPIQVKSTFPGTQKIEVTGLSADGLTTLGFSCEGVDFCQKEIDTALFRDGSYDVVATVTYNGKKAVSQHQQFYVSNQVSSRMSVNYTGKDVDLSLPLNGRVEFKIQSESGAVPFSELRFRVLKAGKEVYSKVASIALPQMTFGWRTASVPNGEYEIQFQGILPVAGKQVVVESLKTTVKVQNSFVH